LLIAKMNITNVQEMNSHRSLLSHTVPYVEHSRHTVRI
jgi:hypothetical protein